MLRTYYTLTKPGIIYGNAITAAAGFLLASAGHIDYWLLLATLLGMSLVIASGCVFNNYTDRELDAKMARTKKRALASGLVSGRSAIIYATVLGLAGFVVLALYTNRLTVGIGLVGLFVYVVLYGASKRRSIHGTLVGSIAGATPPVAGYCAVTDRFDSGALILFLILVFWQMAHFYAIATYRLNDYQAAGIPVLPVKKGILVTKVQILIYMVAFVVAALMLTVFGYTGYSYLVAIAILGLAWLWLGVQGLTVRDSKLWARQIFLSSLVVIISLSVLLSIGAILP